MNPVSQLQADLYDILRQDATLAEVPILSESKGVTESDIENALSIVNEGPGGKIGAVVIVMMPLLDVPLPNPPGPRFDLTMTIRVIENPLMNRTTGGTELTAEDIMLQIAHVLHGRRVHPDIREFYMDAEAATPVNLSDNTVAYDLRLKAGFGLASPSRVSMPVFSGNASALDIACNTPAASIYYTLDGSFPTPDDTLYGITLLTEGGSVIVTEAGINLISPTPLVIDPGVTVRAAAYATGYQTSNGAAWTAPD